MPINTGVSASTRKPGTFQALDVTSGHRGLVPITRRAVAIGACLKTTAWITSTAYVLGDFVTNAGNLYRCTVAGTSGSTAPTHTSGTASDGTDTWAYVQAAPLGSAAAPTQMFSDADADNYWGPTSEMALMVKAMLKGTSAYGKSPQIWACAINDPSGARATFTLTLTGSATAADNIVIRIAGRSIASGVAVGDSVTTMASNLVAAINRRYANLPGTASSSAGVVTFKLSNYGVNGNDLQINGDHVPPGVVNTIAAGVSGSGVSDPQAALDVLVDKVYHSVAIANHLSADITELKTYIDLRGGVGTKSWTTAYLAETGTFSTGTTLGTTSNKKEIVVVSAKKWRNTCGEIAAMMAAVVEGEDNVSLSFDNVELPLYPPDPSDTYPTDSVIETAIAAGCTILQVNDARDGAKIVKLVTSKTTEGGNPFEDVADISTVRTLFYTMTQVDAALKVAFPRANKNARTKKRIKTVVLDVLHKEEELEYLQNVDAHAGELVVDDDITVHTRANVGIPASVVPNLHQICGLTTLLIE